MGVLTNVFRRGGVFYFRARVPAPLRVRVGRKELWRSLRTPDPAEARRRGGILLSLTEDLWRDLQRAMSADEIQLLIDGWVRARLEDDADVRRTLDREGVEQHHAKQMEAFGGALLRKIENDPQDAKPYVEELARTLNLDLSDRDFDTATRLMIRAHYELLRALIARHTRQWRPLVDEDPASALVARVEAARSLPVQLTATPLAEYGRLGEVAREAIKDLARTNAWRPKRLADYENAVATMILAMGRDPDMGEITPDIAGSFMRDLTRYPSNVTKRKPYRDLTTFQARIDAVMAANDDAVLDPVTINGKYLTPLRRIYDWRKTVRRDLANPFTDLHAEKSKRTDPTKKRRDFSNDEVIRWLAMPMFTGSKSVRGDGLYESGSIKIDDWRVWVPLICLFSGMRLNEACGLAVQDVRHADDIVFFHVRDEVEGQNLKTITARRKVPIHSELEHVGFLRFVDRQRALGRTRLFEELEEDANGYFSTGPSQWFGRVIDRIEDEQPDDPGSLVFHSTRHTVITRLRAADVRTDISKEIVGHEQGEVHGGYGSYPLALLRESVNRITYPGLDLGPVSRA